ncbi:MAG: Lrp/AsnC family transcriptional regulator [Candidatus Aenigmarchaeota archaeon]|nr:Lrp/AsnC family transcriptional regulator [Candidatus Aenigmarchaeota archaeon]
MVKLNVKDKKILYELDKDARQPLSKIAKKVGLSKEVVNYRIKDMEKEGIIEGYYTALDLSRIGYMFCRILIKLHGANPKKENEIINYCKSSPYIGWMFIVDGRWDIALAVYAKNIKDLEKICDEIMHRYGKFIADKYISIATTIYHFKHNYLFDTNDYSQYILGDIEKVELAATDLKILEMLAKNARMSTTDIAKNLNLSSNAVKYRIKNMIKNKAIIAFRIKINVNKLGYEYYKVLLMLKEINKERMDKLIGYLRMHSNVIYITKAIGISDLEFEVILRNQSELHKILKEMKFRFSDIIKDYDTMLFTEELIVNYFPRGCLL